MPVHIKSYLEESHQEPMPEWLAGYQKGDSFDRSAFFASRIVFYPGYGDDGQPVRLFGAAGAAHVFVMADYGVERNELLEKLGSEDEGFSGYDLLALLDLSERDLVPNGWTPTLPREMIRNPKTSMDSGSPYGLVAIFERRDEFDSTHGPSRFSILFLGADGIAAYDALFCQPGMRVSPFAAVLQDHGFGGNYSRFGQGGLLHRIADAAKVYPRFILANERKTRLWPGYSRVEGVHADPGGVYGTPRSLFLRDAEE